MTTPCGVFLAMSAPGGGAQGQQSPSFMMVWLAIMVGLFYFMLIRPQQRKERERKALINAVKTGDNIVFGGGILGVVRNVKDNTIVVRIADGVKMEILRSAVSSILNKEEKAD